jgi:hypothetical protein
MVGRMAARRLVDRDVALVELDGRDVEKLEPAGIVGQRIVKRRECVLASEKDLHGQAVAELG